MTNQFGSSNFNQERMSELAYRNYMGQIFGSDFYSQVLSGGSDVYTTGDSYLAVDFKDHDCHFTLIAVPGGWQLNILKDGEPFYGESVMVPPQHKPEDMVLVFHALKSEMILKLEQATLADKDGAKLLTDKDALLPGTTLNLNEWECQLILAYVQAGKPPAVAVKMAKVIVYGQLTKDWKPGNFSMFEKCKPSANGFDQN